MGPKPAGFKPADICRIIEACSKFSVSEIRFSGFEIKFKELGLPAIVDPPKTITRNFSHQASETDTVDPKIGMLDEQLMEDMRRAQLMIDDPLAYEQEIIDEMKVYSGHSQETHD